MAAAELLVHPEDDPGRDILEGSADVAFVGGFAAAVAALGGKADLVVLDTTDPARPRARSLTEAVTRVVRARALNPRFIAGQMRHGPRGAAELAETVDRLVGFAETTDAVAEALIEAVHAAYVEDPAVRAFLLDENPAAARAIAERFAAARRRGLWHPRRNAVDEELARLVAEARAREAGAHDRGACAAAPARRWPRRCRPATAGWRGWRWPRLTAAQLAGLAAAAARLGNGIVEVTARGSLQVRGLTPASAAELAAALDELGIAVAEGLPVVTGPLAGARSGRDRRSAAAGGGAARRRGGAGAAAEGLGGGRRRRGAAPRRGAGRPAAGGDRAGTGGWLAVGGAAAASAAAALDAAVRSAARWRCSATMAARRVRGRATCWRARAERLPAARRRCEPVGRLGGGARARAAVRAGGRGDARRAGRGAPARRAFRPAPGRALW